MPDDISSTTAQKTLSDNLVEGASQLEMLYQLRDNGGLDKDCEYLIPLLETAFFTDVSIAEILSYDEASKYENQRDRNFDTRYSPPMGR